MQKEIEGKKKGPNLDGSLRGIQKFGCNSFLKVSKWGWAQLNSGITTGNTDRIALIMTIIYGDLDPLANNDEKQWGGGGGHFLLTRIFHPTGGRVSQKQKKIKHPNKKKQKKKKKEEEGGGGGGIIC